MLFWCWTDWGPVSGFGGNEGEPATMTNPGISPVFHGPPHGDLAPEVEKIAQLHAVFWVDLAERSLIEGDTVLSVVSGSSRPVFPDYFLFTTLQTIANQGSLPFLLQTNMQRCFPHQLSSYSLLILSVLWMAVALQVRLGPISQRCAKCFKCPMKKENYVAHEAEFGLGERSSLFSTW